MRPICGINPPLRKATPAAFTLLEVILALALLSLLSGMVFGIVRVSMRTAFDTQKVQQENDQISHFIKLCRQTFQNLPATAILTLEITQTGIPAQQELTLSGVPECFAFGSNPLSYEDTIIGQRPDLRAVAHRQQTQLTASSANSSGVPYFVGISRPDLLQTDGANVATAIQVNADSITAPDEQGRYWMPLLTNVSSLTWRFYHSAEDLWEEEWDSATLPELVEMNLLMLDRTVPIRMVFAIPTTKLSAANPALAPSNVQNNNTTSTTNSGNANNANSPNAEGRGGGTGFGGRGGRGGRGGNPNSPPTPGNNNPNQAPNSNNRSAPTQPSNQTGG